MQRPDEHKRQLIMDTAARLFATRPFHKVRLDDIAAEAKLGKGTLYIYFENKDALYVSLIHQGFGKLLDELEAELADEAKPAVEGLAVIVRHLVGFAFSHPHFFELMRTATVLPGHETPAWRGRREALQRLVVGTIRRGARRRELRDPHPELTALCIPGMVRSVMLFGPKGMDERTVADQIVRLLTRGLVPRG